jgi:hypothetical protein
MTPPQHAAPASTADDLDGVRAELRRLGYLDHRFGRFLLQDALRPRRPLRALLELTARVALLGSLLLALVLALALTLVNGNLTSTPLDLAAAFLHLLPPTFLASALLFLALGGALIGVLHLFPVRRIEALSLAVAVGVAALALAAALPVVRELGPEGRAWGLALVGLATPLAVVLIVRLLDEGLLSLAIRFASSPARAPAADRLFSRRSRRAVAFILLAVAAGVVLPALLVPRRPVADEPAGLPTGPGERAVLIGVDGVLPEELDYLRARGELPHLGALLAQGELHPYARRAGESPASFWTGVATGIPGPRHGVTALDSFRPLGMRTPLSRNGPLRLYWSRVEVPLHLAEYRPLLANRRRAFTVWELAARGGAPVVAVNWWATFPAAPISGLVVAHGAYQLLAERAEGAIAPASERAAIAGLLRAPDVETVGLNALVAGALPPAQARSALDRALLPDAFYRRVFAERLARSPRLAALYLPGLDIAAQGWAGSDLALADLVRRELVELDRLIGQGLGGAETVFLVLDPGRRREGGTGRVALWRQAWQGSGGCGAFLNGAPGAAPAAGPVAPEAIAATLLRALGLPQSRELPAPLGRCPWPSPPAVVGSYGEPRVAAASRAAGGEYLQSLRSLGYL